MTQSEIIQIITGCLGSLGFGILFNVRGKRLAVSTLGGFLAWTAFIIFSRFISDDAVNYLIVAALVSLYAEIMARVCKTPTTAFITLSLIPLIPGGSLYYTMAYAFESNVDEFLDRGIYTLKLAAALAIGIIISTAICKLIFGFINKARKTSC